MSAVYKVSLHAPDSSFMDSVVYSPVVPSEGDTINFPAEDEGGEGQLNLLVLHRSMRFTNDGAPDEILLIMEAF
ncbi:MAG: hypothetical protein GY901_10275 [Actinomycetia bacterium]|nr:hypothetical protein [Actinomycetes bacterium]